MADVKISFGKPIVVQRADSTIEISGANGKGKLGKFVFSQGSVEWFPKGRSVNVKRYTWEELAKVLSENGTHHKVAPKKAVK